MMNFKEFCNYIESELPKYMTEQENIISCAIHNQTKTNDIKLTGVVIQRENSNKSPVIYLEGYYDNYVKGEFIGNLLSELAKEYENAEKLHPQIAIEVSDIDKYEKVKENIFPRVVGFNRNREQLLNMPHARIEDLAITYHIEITDEASIKVDNKLMEMWGVEPEEIKKNAIENSQIKKPAVLVSMFDLVTNKMQIKENLLEKKEKGIDDSLFVISNKDNTYGAITIFYPDMARLVGETLGSDYYILPSSVHECILLKKDENVEEKHLFNLVRDANETVVEKKDVLSDSVYLYNSREKTISRVAEPLRSLNEFERG